MAGGFPLKELNASRHERQSIRTPRPPAPMCRIRASTGVWEWALKKREAHGTR